MKDEKTLGDGDTIIQFQGVNKWFGNFNVLKDGKNLSRMRWTIDTQKDFEFVRKNLDCYLLANMTEFGKTKLLNYKELENLGYNIVIYNVTTQRLAMKNV